MADESSARSRSGEETRITDAGPVAQWGVRKCRDHWHLTSHGEDAMMEPFDTFEAANEHAERYNFNPGYYVEPGSCDRASVPNTGTALSEEGVWVVLDAEGLPEAVYCREDTAREYADDPNENKAGEGPFTVARFVRAASVVRLDGKPDVRDADGYISGDPMLAGPELTMLREMADLVREYFDERNRPSVSWDGMPSVQEQKHRRERIVAIIARVSSAPSRGSESDVDPEQAACARCGLPKREHRMGYAAHRCAFYALTVAPLVTESAGGTNGQ